MPATLKEALEGTEADEDAADADVVAELVEAQVPVLLTAIAQVQAHHDTLPT